MSGVIDSQLDDSVRWHREHRDERENTEGIPPASEEIRHECVWVVEAYPPSTVDSLVEGLRKNGFDVPEFIHTSNTITWLIDSRRDSLFGGGWANLSVIGPPNQKSWMPYRAMKLPEGVQYVQGGLHQALPSVTFALFQFVLTAPLDCAVENGLRRRYESFAEHIPGGYIVHSPTNQRIQAVRQARLSLLDSCTEWVATHFPGFFSRTHTSARRTFPTCELITLKEQCAFEVDRSLAPSDYRRIIGIDRGIDAWESSEISGLRLGQPLDRWHGDQPWSWILAGRWSEIFSDEQLSGFAGGRSREGITGRLWMTVDRTLTMLALWALLHEWATRLAIQRDEVARFTSPNDLQQLLRFQAELGSQHGSLLPILHEVDRLAEDESLFMYDLCKLSPTAHSLDDRKPLFVWMRENIKNRTEILREREAAIRQSIAITTQTLQAVTQEELAAVNLRLQRSMAWLTGIGIVVAIVALIVGLPAAVPKWGDWLLKLATLTAGR